jgi:hypothetical protein
MKRNRSEIATKARGFGILGWLLMIPVVIIVLLILTVGFYEGRKAYWNSKVREMCEKDGGVRVNETVQLGQQQYVLLLNKFGQLSPPSEDRAGSDVPIVHRFTSTYIRRADPEVRRDELAVIRKSDNAVLGASISYSRVGGELFALHPSYFSCPERSTDLFSAVVQQRKEEK